jgi:hypothetical protein
LALENADIVDEFIPAMIQIAIEQEERGSRPLEISPAIAAR